MSNPWSTSARDLALAPLYKTLKSFDEDSSRLSTPQVDLSGNSFTHDDHSGTTEDGGNSDEGPSASPSPEKKKKKYHSSLIAQLKMADEINFARRLDPSAVTVTEEDRKTVLFSRKLTKIFNILSKSLEQFQKADVLKTAYLQAFLANQLVWDDISQENKTKLIRATQNLLRQLFLLLETQAVEYPSCRHCIRELTEVSDRTGIMREDISFDSDSFLQDLFEVLMDCTGVLEVIRLQHAPRPTASQAELLG